MTEEAARLLAKARQCLADAALYQPMVPRIAGREAYLAAFHGAAALILERTGRVTKTHRGTRVEFARLVRDDAGIDPGFVTFLAQAYELKALADYGTGPEAEITRPAAMAAIVTATCLLDRITSLLGTTPPDAA